MNSNPEPVGDEPIGPSIPLHVPVIVTDGGPWAVHDYACPICQIRKAMLNLNSGRFNPCDHCGQWWELHYRSRLIRRLFRRYP